MDQQQLGERFGRLEEKQDGLDRRLDEFQRISSAEHDEVKTLLTELLASQADKADKKEVEDLEVRTDKLESRSDKIMAVVGLVIFLSPFIIGILLQITGGS